MKWLGRFLGSPPEKTTVQNLAGGLALTVAGRTQTLMEYFEKEGLLDRFLSRATRALLWHEIKVLARDCEIEWRMAPALSDLDGMPPERRAFLLSRSVGGDVFRYAGYVQSGSPSSLWFFRFYEGVEFMTRCRPAQT